MTTYNMGMVGLGVMGANLARNLVRNGFSVIGYDLDPEKAAAFNEYADEGPMKGVSSVDEFIESLDVPRRILLLVPSSAVDAAIESLKPHLDEGDLLIDSGNSFFGDTERRNKELEEDDLLFIGTGISGGEYGALHGPSIMPGGQPEAYELVAPMFEAVAAKVGGEPCVTHIGPRGAGHYVKMVHNGIEYAIMQLTAEAYDLMKRVGGGSAEEIAEAFWAWNDAELESYLIEITAKIFDQEDAFTDGRLIDSILDEAKQKGTGKWTSQNAYDVGIPTHTINAAVTSRVISALREERLAAEKVLEGPEIQPLTDADARAAFFDKVGKALYAAVIASFAQGIRLIQDASDEYGYDVNIAEIAKIWRGGCIIRAAMLEDIRKVYAETPDIKNLLLAEPFKSHFVERQDALRDVIKAGVENGVPVLAFSSVAAYFDAYRTGRLPANLTQAQRDFFGSHTYRRLDREGSFHTEWPREE
jgi:6-phosphogluconate dehydrogenase